MEFALKNYSCSLCNKENAKLLLTKQGFSIVKCNNCDFVYVNPRVENRQLNAIYHHSYFKNKDYGYAGYEQEKKLRIKNFERWLKDAADFIPQKTCLFSLDIGCAAGYCLDVMKDKGWITKGLELDEEMCQTLKNAGYDISETEIENFETDQKFSVITLFDVIEHIPNLDATFSKFNSLLEKEGIVIIVTPDYNSFQRKLFGKAWFQYKPIEHIQYFDVNTLKAFAERNGLEIIYKKKCGQYADSNFLINRLNYYHFNFFAKTLDRLFRFLRLKNSFFYTDTGSLFVILKSK